MKLRCLKAIWIILLVFCPLSAAGQSPPEPIGRISFMVGDVEISCQSAEWILADFDAKVFEGCEIRTGPESRCEILLSDGDVLRMDQNSSQSIETSRSGEKTSQKSIFLSAGKLWINARKVMDRDNAFKVRTDKAVCAIRGTHFGVDTDPNATRIHVYQGKVETWRATEPETSSPVIQKPSPVPGPKPVSLEKWVEIVQALQQITVDAKGSYQKSDMDLKQIMEDPWATWNMSRDNLSISQ